mgnify:CR=1 FL=1
MNSDTVKGEAGEQPVLAICYDFDKTLSPDDMQAQGYIQSVGYDTEAFWREANLLAQNNDMDPNLAYMYLMVREAEGHLVFTKEALARYGAGVRLFPGVEGWFERIGLYGQRAGVKVEHYIISSGLREMIEGTSIAKAGVFERIYASSFYYNSRGVAVWPAMNVNYTNKTQFLFRIRKGVPDVTDPAVNDYFPPDKLRVPFRNMVYIGDSDTDVPCMKLVNVNGGYSIGVYNADTKDKTKVYKMMRENRIKYYAPADYSEGKELDILLKAIIDRTAENEALESRFYAYKREQTDADKQTNETEREKVDLLIKLENSRSFATTHAVIEKMRQITVWTKDETENLFTIAVNNSQVFYILGDMDVKAFYQKLLNGCKVPSENAEKIKARIEETDRL